MESFLDILMAHDKARLGTEKTFVVWNAEREYFEALQEGVQLWAIPFGDRDPEDVERDVLAKLWQSIG